MPLRPVGGNIASLYAVRRRWAVGEGLKFVRQGSFLRFLSFFPFIINELGSIRIRRFRISPSSQHYCNTASRSHFRWRLSFPGVACPEPAPSQSELPPDSRQSPTDFGPVVHIRAAEPRLAASSMVRPRIGSPTVVSADRAGAFDLRVIHPGARIVNRALPAVREATRCGLPMPVLSMNGGRAGRLGLRAESELAHPGLCRQPGSVCGK